MTNTDNAKSGTDKPISEKAKDAATAATEEAKGTNDLKLSSLAPTRTAKNVKRDAQAVKKVYDDK